MHKACPLLDQIVDFESQLFANTFLQVLGEKQLSLASNRGRVQNVVEEWLQACLVARGLWS